MNIAESVCLSVCLSVNEDAPSLEFVVLSKSTTNITKISSSPSFSSSSLLIFLFVWNTWSFTSAPSRSLRDAMPRWKNKYFILFHLRKTHRISVFQIHSHCLFQFYQTCREQNVLRVDLFTPLYGLSVAEDRCFWGLLGCYAALIGGWLLTFRDRLLVSSSRVKQFFLVILKQIA